METHKEKEKQPQAQPVSTPQQERTSLPAESQLISFGDRITYVFSFGKEVGSIHFDSGRGEIFYKGHNIRNMEIESWHMQVLEKLRQILNADDRGQPFSEDYARVLDKIVLEKASPKKV